MNITQLKHALGWATIFFTVTTAMLLLVAIWGVWDWLYDYEELTLSSITLAAFSFVHFVVLSFWKK